MPKYLPDFGKNILNETRARSQCRDVSCLPVTRLCQNLGKKMGKMNMGNIFPKNMGNFPKNMGNMLTKDKRRLTTQRTNITIRNIMREEITSRSEWLPSERDTG